MIDTHSHIYLPEFESDLNLVLERARKEGISKILMPAIDSSTHKRMNDVEQQNAD